MATTLSCPSEAIEKPMTQSLRNIYVSAINQPCTSGTRYRNSRVGVPSRRNRKVHQTHNPNDPHHQELDSTEGVSAIDAQDPSIPTLMERSAFLDRKKIGTHPYDRNSLNRTPAPLFEIAFFRVLHIFL